MQIAPGLRRMRWFACALALLCAAATSLAATPLPDSTSESILAVAHLHPGCCYPDTVWGRPGAEHGWLPTRITWGGYDSLHTPPCLSGPTHRPKLRETTFEYPTWPHLGTAMAAQLLSLGDTLTDLVFYIWGGVSDTTNPHDSTRVAAIFGQAGLDSIATINFATLSDYQTLPFFAMDLHVGSLFVQPDNRDLSGVTSYILQPVGGGPPSLHRIQPAATPPWDVRLHPNPAVTSTQIEGTPIPPGEYRVEVIGVDGALRLHEQVTVQESGELFGTLDLAALPSGFYLVRLYNATTLVGSYPIVKTH